MIRKLELKFGVKAPMYPWESFLLENRKNEGKLCVYFASLEWLVLDIRDWEIVEDNYLVVCYSLPNRTIMTGHCCTDKPFLFFSRFGHLPRCLEARWV